MKERYCHISWDKKKKKKVVDFGKKWGAMKKKDANASFVQTGNGLYVIDIDSKKIPKKYKKWVQSLGTPTVETKRGYHFYIKSDAPMRNHQNIFNDENFKVDIRGAGGIVFSDYWGDSKKISYLKSGKVIKDKKFKIFKSLPESVRIGNKRKTKERGDVGKVELEKLKNALKKVDVKDYRDRDKWMQMLAAIYHGGGVDAEKIARKWSKKDKKEYDKDAFDDVWYQLETGKYGSDISVGTLFHAAYGDREEPTSLFKKEDGDVQPDQAKKKKKSKKKKDSSYNPLDAGERLNDAMLEERKNQKVLFDSVVVERMHTFIYGAAGSNKTTVISWIAVDMLKKHQDKVVHFWSFDAADNHENAIYQYGKDEGVSDRFHIYTTKTSEDYYLHYERAIEEEADLSSLIIIIDTWKFVTKDVNSKGANKEAMHFIKQLQRLGATVVSLGHTNKDGLKNSGTAEIEQDSDAVLRIDRKADEFSKEVILTIQSAGRTRFSCTGVTFKSNPKGSDYKYLYTSLTTMVKSKFIDLTDDVQNGQEEVKTINNKDRLAIKEIKRIIADLEKLRKKNKAAMGAVTGAIVMTARKEEGLTEKKVKELLREHAEGNWKYKFVKDNSGKRVKRYTLLK